MAIETRLGIVEALCSMLEQSRVIGGDGVEAYRLGGKRPAAAVLPADEAQVAAVLRLAHGERWGVVPWGGGMHQSGGRAPSRYEVALDLGGLNRVIRYEPADMTVTAEAGIRLRELQSRLAESGQFLSLDPPGAERATLGGVLAANGCGPLRCRYGTARDVVLGVRVAQADGTITKAGAGVVKNATAYDLTKLYIGSHGTLGVLLSATLRVQPLPACEESGWMALPTLERGGEMVRSILASRVALSRLELLDAVGARACGISGAGPVLAMSVGGRPESMAEQVARLAALAAERGAGWSGMAADAWRRVRDFPWQETEPPLGVGDVRWRASVLPDGSADAMRSVADAVGSGGDVAMAASASHGVVRGILRRGTEDAAVRAVRAARDAIESRGGFLVVTDAPDRLRDRLEMWGPPPETAGVLEKIRAAFDPEGILNPGRFLVGGGTSERGRE